MAITLEPRSTFDLAHDEHTHPTSSRPCRRGPGVNAAKNRSTEHYRFHLKVRDIAFLRGPSGKVGMTVDFGRRSRPRSIVAGVSVIATSPRAAPRNDRCA